MNLVRDTLRRIAAVIGVVFLAVLVLFSVSAALLRERMFQYETGKLDRWVASGAGRDTLRTEVVPICTNLIETQAGWFERLELLSIDRDDLDSRIDLCAKMTANRREPQPEFQDAKRVSAICDGSDPGQATLRRLCRRSGLRPAIPGD